jgi:hypothetical protein
MLSSVPMVFLGLVEEVTRQLSMAARRELKKAVGERYRAARRRGGTRRRAQARYLYSQGARTSRPSQQLTDPRRKRRIM